MIVMKIVADKVQIEELLTRAVDIVYPSRESFKNLLMKGVRLRIYLGIDPTGPHLHLGHATNLLVLRRFQRLGHEIILLIGDFTARIGDPTDKAAARQPLSEQEVKQNMRTFKRQAARVLNFRGPNPVKIRFNSKWFGKMKFEDMLRLMQEVTVQQMEERDMFASRLKEGRRIGIHEFTYPLMQGYDSVALDVDAEIGGTDQTFNMLMGRTLMKRLKHKEKFVLTTKLLEHPETGKKLMNKSEGGLINLDDAPENMFGKVMALDDVSMIPVAEFCTEMPLGRIAEIKNGMASGDNPRDAKSEIAENVVATFYGERDARKSREQFKKIFSKKETPDDLPELSVPEPATTTGAVLASGLLKSKSEARRLIEQGGVSVGGAKVKDPYAPRKDGEVIKIGKKHFFKIRTK